MKIKKLFFVMGVYLLSTQMQHAYADSYCEFDGIQDGNFPGLFSKGRPFLSVYQIYTGMPSPPSGSEIGTVRIKCREKSLFQFNRSTTPDLKGWTNILGTDPRNDAKYSISVRVHAPVTPEVASKCNQKIEYDAVASTATILAGQDCKWLSSLHSTGYTEYEYYYYITYYVTRPMKLYSEQETPLGELGTQMLTQYTIRGDFGQLSGGVQLGLIPRIDQCTNPDSFIVNVDKKEIDLSVAKGGTKNESFNINITKRNPINGPCKRPVKPRIIMKTTGADAQGVINVGNGYNLILTDWDNRPVIYGIYTDVPTMDNAVTLRYRVKFAPRAGAKIQEGEFNHVIHYGIEYR